MASILSVITFQSLEKMWLGIRGRDPLQCSGYLRQNRYNS
jgi:hypothetical protein